MKKLTTILFLLFAISGWSQIITQDFGDSCQIQSTDNLGGYQTITFSNDTAKISGTLTVDTIRETIIELQPDEIMFHYAHSVQSFKDSAVVISGGTNVQVTNAGDSLWREFEMEDITYLLGDTIEIDIHGAYNIFLSISGYGTNAVDWNVNIAKKSGGVTTYMNSVLEFTTTGGTNKNGGFKMWYAHGEIGDKFWVVLTRTSGSGDFTISSSSLYFEQYYAR